ncbi:MAG TPA: cysteine desulfurase-like protein [Pseudonocardiaceae bacterium]|jgi:cysteine desulfurase family protein (TIGR01976 family)|nr:cysteine desulfurase-like protein [Pseudonocardiaceae bacterium]
MAFDVARVRGLFPALGDGWVHLDGALGMQVPEQVAMAVATALRAPVSAPGGVFPSSQRGMAIVDAARRCVADLVGVDPAGVVLGPSIAVLLAKLADALGAGWLLGDEIVLSRLDHQVNVAPWMRAAQRCGATVRWAEVDIETCELPSWQYDELVTRRTKLVAVTAASTAVGTRPEVTKIADRARSVGAVVVVDASGAAPFMPLDATALGADVLAVSGLAWGGPPVAALAFRDPRMLERLPSCSLDPDARGPERLELGPHPHAMLAGLVASVDYLAELDDTAVGPRRERLLTSLGSVKAYQAGLLAHLTGELRALRHVTVIGDAMRRVPVMAFTVAGRKCWDVVEALAESGVCAFADAGHHDVFATLGVGEVGGVIQVGLAHYTTVAELNTLVHATARLR